MLVLALDTTTRSGSCAVARAGVVLREQANASPNAQAARLPGELMTLLDRAGITLGEIDLFAVATGPGSFTGLRIGIATMQGLAFAANKPLIGVSGFDALASVAGSEGRVATWVDAWRGEVFAALYEDGTEIEPPTVARPDDLLEQLRRAPVRFVGDGAVTHGDVIRRALGDDARVFDPAAPLLAGAVALLAAASAAAGECPPPHAIRPLYVRRPDVELARDARASK
jgi:tRNA threonylcarbamoyladenosine biosynthesis protein TsaB